MINPITIAFAVENREEFNELIMLVKELDERYEQKRKFILLRTHLIFRLDDYSLEHSKYFEEIYTARNPFKKNFKQVSLIKKVLIILSNIPLVIKIVRHHQLNFMLSGVPLILHRIIRLFSPHTIHLAYIRGLLLYSQKTTSVSDRFYFLTRKIFGINSIRFFNNYYADHLFTIGAINKKTLLERHIPESNIYISGPLLLDRFRQLNEQDQQSYEKTEVVYITQAYTWHLDTHGHAEQLNCIAKLCETISQDYANVFTLTIRVHPRDDKHPYLFLLKKYPIDGKIDTSLPAQFLHTISRQQILISGLSTLAFEWIYLGGICVFYTSDKLFQQSQEMFKQLNISPYLSEKNMLEDIREKKYTDYREQIEKIFYRHPSTNLMFVVKKINSIIND